MTLVFVMFSMLVAVSSVRSHWIDITDTSWAYDMTKVSVDRFRFANVDYLRFIQLNHDDYQGGSFNIWGFHFGTLPQFLEVIPQAGFWQGKTFHSTTSSFLLVTVNPRSSPIWLNGRPQRCARFETDLDFGQTENRPLVSLDIMPAAFYNTGLRIALAIKIADFNHIDSIRWSPNRHGLATPYDYESNIVLVRRR